MCATGLLAAALGHAVPAQAQAREVAEIEAFSVGFVQAFNNLDWPVFSAAFSDSASVFFPFPDTPSRLDGRAAVLERFERYFAQVRAERSGPPYLFIAPRATRLDLLTRTSAIVTFEFPSGELLARRTLVLVRERDGRWRIRHLHASMTKTGP